VGNPNNQGNAFFGDISDAPCTLPAGEPTINTLRFWQGFSGTLSVTGNVDVGGLSMYSSGGGVLDDQGQTVTAHSLNWQTGTMGNPNTLGTFNLTMTRNSSITPGANTLITGDNWTVSGGYVLTVNNATGGVQWNNNSNLTITGTSTNLYTFGGSFTQGTAGAGTVSLTSNGRWVLGDTTANTYTFTSALSLTNSAGLFSVLPNVTVTFNNANLTGGAGVGNCTIINNASGGSGQNGYKLGFCINDGGTVNSTAGNIKNSGDFFSWAPTGTTSGTATVTGRAGQSYGFFMTGGNLWADYNLTTTGVGSIRFRDLSGTFSGGTVNVGVWEGGGGLANGSPSTFQFDGVIAIGNQVTSVSPYTVGLGGGQVANGQRPLPFLISLQETASGTWVSSSPPIGDGSGHNWTITPGLVVGMQVSWNIGTSW